MRALAALGMNSVLSQRYLIRHFGLWVGVVFSVAVSPVKTSHAETSNEVFRLHMPVEPHGLDPAGIVANDASYFFFNLFRGLYTYTTDQGLQGADAEKCSFEGKKQKRLRCRLRSDRRWSDGSPLVAEDYVRSFRHLLSPGSRNTAVELLKNLQNALPVFRGELAAEKLGVRAIGERELVFDFSNPDPEFLYKLSASVIVPIKTTTFHSRDQAHLDVVNGPYKVVQWVPHKKIRLESNPYFRGPHDSGTLRPPVEVLFVDDDQTALNLYEKGLLTFLRRLPTTYIGKFKGRKDFHQFPVARFDYIGFGPELRSESDLRAALSLSLDFSELKKIYDALGIPGCPSFSERLMDHPHCVTFDLTKARERLTKVPEAVRGKRLKFMFSKLGGDDVKKGAEWMQAQWRKNLGLKVDLEQTEQGVFLERLKSQPPAIFRKGVGLERPTCLSAIETFLKTGPENFLKIDDPVYEQIHARLMAAAENPAKMRSICREGVEYLINRNLMVPLGRIHLTMLASPRFQGWSLNEMNQLDLSSLRVAP
jgi:oligopeptide transport system substrate-binding protein